MKPEFIVLIAVELSKMPPHSSPSTSVEGNIDEAIRLVQAAKTQAKAVQPASAKRKAANAKKGPKGPGGGG